MVFIRTLSLIERSGRSDGAEPMGNHVWDGAQPSRMECPLCSNFWNFVTVRGFAVFAWCLALMVSCSDMKVDVPPLRKESDRNTDSFTLIVLPDTQGYADVRHKETQKHWPEIGDQRSCFFKQTEWIKENKQTRNIAMAIHVGDITQTDHHETVRQAIRVRAVLAPTSHRRASQRIRFMTRISAAIGTYIFEKLGGLKTTISF